MDEGAGRTITSGGPHVARVYETPDVELMGGKGSSRKRTAVWKMHANTVSGNAA